MADNRGTHSPERVIVVPRNGYVNRLQAWASSAILAAELDVPLTVYWEPEDVAPAAFADLFIPGRPGASLIDDSALRDVLGCMHDELPRYLSVDESRRLVVLAGHDRGEQAFMSELTQALDHPCRPTTLLIIAGGRFHLSSSNGFAAQRRHFYQRLPWSDAVTFNTDIAVGDRQDFLGLHVRQTDRSVAAPRPRAIRDAIRQLATRTGISSVFVAADTPEGRVQWLAELELLGLSGWSAPEPNLDRSTAGAGVDAMVDWRVLSRSRGIVYSRASSFGEEAAVAADVVGVSTPLSASDRLQRTRRAADLGRALVTYPRRRLAQGRNPS